MLLTNYLVNRRDLMKEIITEIINEWDPIDLFPFAPQDEYKKEIDNIIKLINGTKDIDDISNGIYTIFSESFGDDVLKKNLNDCISIAALIIKRL